MESNVNHRMLTLPQMSQVLGISAPTIKRMLARGQFPQPVHVGAHPRWAFSVVRAWAEGRWTPETGNGEAA
jgi:predicted DNA-binding transcriptional regulator AlpA